MIRYSGENFDMPAAYVSASACMTTLAMTDDEKRAVKRRPIGFASVRSKPRLCFRNGHWFVVFADGDPFVEQALRWALDH